MRIRFCNTFYLFLATATAAAETTTTTTKLLLLLLLLLQGLRDGGISTYIPQKATSKFVVAFVL